MSNLDFKIEESKTNQQKLNEILELCVQKSEGVYFYVFEWNAGRKCLTISKYDSSYRDWSGFYLEYAKEFTLLDQALEYMQNE